MVECPDCHRTGFTQEELVGHQALPPGHPAIQPLTGRFLREHYRYDAKNPEGLLECGTRPTTPAEDEAATQKRIQDLERIVATIQASAAKTAPPAGQGAKT